MEGLRARDLRTVLEVARLAGEAEDLDAFRETVTRARSPTWCPGGPTRPARSTETSCATSVAGPAPRLADRPRRRGGRPRGPPPPAGNLSARPPPGRDGAGPPPPGGWAQRP